MGFYSQAPLRANESNASAQPGVIQPGSDEYLHLPVGKPDFNVGSDNDPRLTWKAMVQPQVYEVCVQFQAVDCNPTMRLKVGDVWQWCSTRAAPYPYRADDGREDTEIHLENERRTYRGGGWIMNSWRGGSRDVVYSGSLWWYFTVVMV